MFPFFFPPPLQAEIESRTELEQRLKEAEEALQELEKGLNSVERSTEKDERMKGNVTQLRSECVITLTRYHDLLKELLNHSVKTFFISK